MSFGLVIPEIIRVLFSLSSVYVHVYKIINERKCLHKIYELIAFAH